MSPPGSLCLHLVLDKAPAFAALEALRQAALRAPGAVNVFLGAPPRLGELFDVVREDAGPEGPHETRFRLEPNARLRDFLASANPPLNAKGHAT